MPMQGDPLYSDLPAAKGEEGAPKPEARWTGPAHLAPTATRKRDTTSSEGPTAKKRPKPLVAYDASEGSDALGDSEASPEPLTSPAVFPAPAPAPPSAPVTPTLIPVEYNPLQPNDYEECLRERRLRMASRRKEEEMERRRKEIQKFDEKEGLTPLELTGDDAWKRRAILSGRSPDEIPDLDPDPEASEEKKLTPAEKMMMAMGWKGEGSGLGKNQDGIATPLMHRKVGQAAGHIVPAPPKPVAPKKGPTAPPAAPKRATKRLRGRPSEVILLRNMVGPGEVDEELCRETEEECQEKYGGVQECKVHEVKDKEVSPQEAVRIFVRFTSIENAVKAAVDLDGRFFAGRTVCACFFDPRRYEDEDLAPGPNEPELPPEILSAPSGV
eukprot:TRINITY_DN4562_c0_g1_i1.p1 TRINITY_DN4562_c0_g1~~TRINITY_DN4562_c0_g1_i1.p1  ORF type:complete len:384 (+),score=83.05 TRINITY_DN4562_c0_g1_i1:34-1185(+)